MRRRVDFCNISEYDTLISERLSVENKAKLSQLETRNTSSVVLFIPVERVSLCSLQITVFEISVNFGIVTKSAFAVHALV